MEKSFCPQASMLTIVEVWRTSSKVKVKLSCHPTPGVPVNVVLTCFNMDHLQGLRQDPPQEFNVKLSCHPTPAITNMDETSMGRKLTRKDFGGQPA